MSKSWKATLRLPKSSFPARPNPALQQQYLRECTDELYSWQKATRTDSEPFVLHDGPPYANGPLHIGHALNKILKDMILRVQVQRGRRVAYRPSWDCHGLPIEIKAIGGHTAKGLSPLKVRRTASNLARKTMAEQMKSFKSFGIMADWEHPWTTMDSAYEARQLRVFQKMLRSGLIYRKHKPVYWSISSKTALAEAELEYRDDHESKSAFIKFPIESDLGLLPELSTFRGKLFALIWTTTPWTLPANRAIAVHKDLLYSIMKVGDDYLLVGADRAEHLMSVIPNATIQIAEISGRSLQGLQYKNKLCGVNASLQPIIHADFVSADSGSGLVHLAPGHGQDDYEVCSAHGIEAVAPVDDEGHFTASAYPDNPDALTSAPNILQGGNEVVLGLLGDDVVHSHTIQHKYPYDWRTKQPVIIRATAQWFADVGSIKEDALHALQGVQFVPVMGKSRLQSFVKGRSEWCISRQRSWGVPIPALYDDKGAAVMTDSSVEHIIEVMRKRGSDAWFSDDPEDPAWVAEGLGGTFRRGTDTMDVWFDSGSSWTETSQPADVYLEGSDQHRGWFQSSLLTYVAAQKEGAQSKSQVEGPFKTLITHGFTLDPQGKKMSKSLGNTISPTEVMDGTLLPPLKARGNEKPRHDALGPDALRLWVASSDFTSDILIGSSVLQPVHTALIKYRTIIKMLLGSLHSSGLEAPLTRLDQLALVQLFDVMQQVSVAFTSYEFHKATQLINRWVSVDLSAFYLEALKDRLYCGDGGGAVFPMLNGLLRMLAPITPILVQEAWASRPSWISENSNFEDPLRQPYDAPLVAKERLTLNQQKLRNDLPVISSVHAAVRSALEKARIAKAVGSSLQCSAIITVQDEEAARLLGEYYDELDAMFVVSSVTLNQPIPDSPQWSFVQDFELKGSPASVHILSPLQPKCSRCWRYLATEDEGLCQRCETAVADST